MDVGQIKAGWDRVVEGLSGFPKNLRNDCGVILPQWLPYNTILIPAAATLAAVGNATGPDVAAIRNKLKRWFWCSVFSQSYEKELEGDVGGEILCPVRISLPAVLADLVATIMLDRSVLNLELMNAVRITPETVRLSRAESKCDVSITGECAVRFLLGRGFPNS